MEERGRFERCVQYEYLDHAQDWLTLTESERWRMTLFPLQQELSRERDVEELARLMAKRVRIIRALLEYVRTTKRFQEEKIDTSYYEF